MPKRVLVVEDSATQARQLEIILLSAGHEVEIARSGELALARLDAGADAAGLEAGADGPGAGADAPGFDLVMSDVVMPGMSGYELCRTIKSAPGFRALPVILLTALNEADDIMRGLACGADNFITKPYEAGNLIKRLETVFANPEPPAGAGPGDLADKVAEESGTCHFHFMGREYSVQSTRRQILTFLTSTFEDYARGRQREQLALRTDADNKRKAAESLAAKNHELVQANALLAEANTKLEQLNEQLREAQARMVRLERDAAEAQMAGGFAHEMRNALAGSKMVIDHALGRLTGSKGLCEASIEILDRISASGLTKGEDAAALRQVRDNQGLLAKTLDIVSRATQRGLDFTDQVMEYSQLGKARPGTSEVRIAEVALAAIRARPENPEVVVDVAISPRDVFVGNQSHLYSTLKNLIDNAHDALEDLPCNQPRRIEISGTREGRSYLLRIRDTGSGIQEKDRARMFEPFFSTRPHERTGLGLSIVMKLVALYGGELEVESAPGKGSIITVQLPADRVPGPERQGVAPVAQD